MNYREDFTWIVGEKMENVILPDPFYFRVNRMDGVGLMGTNNGRGDRLNVETEKGIITKINGLG